ncbi:MAG: hypothetical protein WAU36_04135 [Cyclobacteriaceae bacterium]
MLIRIILMSCIVSALSLNCSAQVLSLKDKIVDLENEDIKNIRVSIGKKIGHPILVQIPWIKKGENVSDYFTLWDKTNNSEIHVSGPHDEMAYIEYFSLLGWKLVAIDEDLGFRWHYLRRE